MSSSFGLSLFISKIPTFLHGVFGVAIVYNGILNSGCAFASGLSAFVSAPLANYIIIRFQIRTILVRKIFQTISLLGPAICLCGITLFPDNFNLTVIGLISAMYFSGFYSGGEWTLVSDYAPNFSGTVFGFVGILSYLTGVLVPHMVGVILDSPIGTLNQKWNNIFYITSLMYLFGAITFIAFGTDKQQSWDKIEPTEKKLKGHPGYDTKDYSG